MLLPFNAITKNSYSAGNTVLLLEAGFPSPEFATYRQWQSIGRQVSKGSKGTRLKRVVIYNKDTEKERQTVKTFNVFNIEQTKVVELASDEAYMANASPEDFTAASVAQLHRMTA